ncbi:MAG: methyltransferase domain-containing protein [Actinomycetota bacterium]|nr:methyltransferase domain-containing protein [Actinomycetota bacterium]
MEDVQARLRTYWDEDAETYDHAASHAASDPVEAAAWRTALLESLPAPGASVLDVGAGTGAMALLAAELGYRVTALDLSSGMLEKARAKASERALDLEFVVGSSDSPPRGPFDAVMERHVLWTTPDPAGTLSAWREVVPSGRLVLLEGVWGSTALPERLKEIGAEVVRRMLGIAPDHHAHYDEEVLAELPLARMTSPAPLFAAVAEAGWRNLRFRRLRDVEWAKELSSPPVLGFLERVPQYVLVADA